MISNIALIISIVASIISGLILLMAILQLLINRKHIKKTLKNFAIFFLVSIAAFVVFGVTGDKSVPTEMTNTPSSNVETQQQSDQEIHTNLQKIDSILKKEMKDNYSDSSWYVNVKSYSLKKNSDGYWIDVKTDLFPKESNKKIAENIAVAFFSVLLDNDKYRIVHANIYGQGDNLLKGMGNPFPRKDA